MVVQRQLSPDKFRDSAWIRSAMGSGLEVGTPGEVALWECVLALWRLKLMEEKGSEDPIWPQHVSAWMVSNGFAIGVDRGE